MVDYSSGLCDKICQYIAEGMSLNAVCKLAGMPHRQTVYEWLMQNRDGFGDKYARAREAQADHFVDEIIEIIDTEPDPARARVRMDGRKWVAGKQAPRKYGDKTTVAGDPENPLTTISRVEYVVVDPAEKRG